MGFFSGLTLLICVILLVVLAFCIGTLLGFAFTMLEIKKQFPEAFASFCREWNGEEEFDDDELYCEI